MTTISYSPICLFTFNRLAETKRTIKALKSNYLSSESELYIFSDGAKNSQDIDKVKDVREYLKTIRGFKRIHLYESNYNKGLASSIIFGVTKVLKKYNSVIVLEDDLITSKNFLDFMNKALDYYEKEPKIQSISGYALDLGLNNSYNQIYFHQRAHSWGWATWKNRWNPEIFKKEEKIRAMNSKKEIQSFGENCGKDIKNMLSQSLNGKIDSWFVWWALNQHQNKAFTVYPILSKTINGGFSKESTHCKGIDVFSINFDETNTREFKFEHPSENAEISSNFLHYYSLKHKILFRIRLLKNAEGISLLIEEFINRVLKFLFNKN